MTAHVLDFVAAHWLQLQLGVFLVFAVCAARAAFTCATGGR